MLRLIKNKQQAEAAKEENKPAEGSATSEEKKDGNAAEGEKFTLKKQSSKEVVEIRKSKSKENVGNVFSLKQKAAGGRAGKKELLVPNYVLNKIWQNCLVNHKDLW